MKWKAGVVGFVVVAATAWVLVQAAVSGEARKPATHAPHAAFLAAKVKAAAPMYPGASAELAKRLQQKISVGFDGSDLIVALRSVSKRAKINVAWHREFEMEEDDDERRVTLEARDASVDSILRTIARMNHLKIEYIGDIVYVSPDEREWLRWEERMRRPIGKIEVELGDGPETWLTLELREDDLPDEMRAHLIRRMLRLPRGDRDMRRPNDREGLRERGDRGREPEELEELRERRRPERD